MGTKLNEFSNSFPWRCLASRLETWYPLRHSTLATAGTIRTPSGLALNKARRNFACPPPPSGTKRVVLSRARLGPPCVSRLEGGREVKEVTIMETWFLSHLEGPILPPTESVAQHLLIQ